MMRILRPPTGAVARWRLAVTVVAVLATVCKLAIAANTFGTVDVGTWQSFAQGVRDYGPVGLYGHRFVALYNHPPLSGWILLGINTLMDLGFPAGLPFLIRVPASVADLVTALVVFELVRRHRPVWQAGLGAAILVASPLLMIVSGFHGNTDPLFVMFALLSLYLVVLQGENRRFGALYATLAGAAFAAAVSVKLVPVVVGPVLLVGLVRHGWRRIALFAAGAAAVFLPLWAPVLLTRWVEVRRDVLGYEGGVSHQWGAAQFLDWAHVPHSVIDLLVSPGRFLILLLSAFLPAYLLWRGRLGAAPAGGLTLVLFLLLSPAFGMQYLAWALAGAFLVDVWAATAYAAAASVFATVVYDHWNGAYPWNWNYGFATTLRPKDVGLMVIAWSALAVVAAIGIGRRHVPAESPGASQDATPPTRRPAPDDLVTTT